MEEKVLVVGGGVVGLAIAWRLRREGYGVQVLVGSDPWQASSASAGVLFPTSDKRASGEPGAYSKRALRLWDDFDQQLGGVITSQKGIWMLGDKQELEGLARAVDLEICRLHENPPFLRPDQKPEYLLDIADGQVVDPRKLVQALLADLQENIVRDRAQGLLLSGKRVTGVLGSQEYLAEHTVLALGALGYDWIETDLRPPVMPLVGEALLLETAEPHPDLPAALYPPGEGSGPLICYGDGSLWWGGSYRRYKRIGANWSEIERIIQRAQKLFPWTEELVIKQVLFGIRPISPDGLPFLGPSSKQGLYIATGHGRDGILQAPLAAEQMLAAIRGNPDEKLLPDRLLPQQ